MKREILFRGKRKDSGQWVEGNLVLVNNGETLKTYPCIVISYDHDTFDWVEVIPESVGMFIGSHAKHNEEYKMIFEGDVLKWRLAISTTSKGFQTRIGVVVFQPEGSRFVARYIDEKDAHRYHEIQPSEGGEAGYFCTRETILSNIHDNPELLNG